MQTEKKKKGQVIVKKCVSLTHVRMKENEQQPLHSPTWSHGQCSNSRKSAIKKTGLE